MLPRTDSPIGGTPALIVVDAQAGDGDSSYPMHSGSGSVPGGWGAIMENIATVVESARAADVPIIWGKGLHRTDIEHVLSTYDVDTVILVGFVTNICVHHTAHGAHERDYAFRVVEEATGAPTPELHEIGLKCMRYLQPRGVRSLEAVTEGLEAYEGNPVLDEVERTGRVTGGTGPVASPD